MAIINISEPTTLDELESHLKTKLPELYTLTRKGKKIIISRDALRGCAVFIKKNGLAINVFPVVPSTLVHLAISLPIIAAAFAIVFYVNVFVGALLVGSPIFLRLIPSLPLAREVREIVGEM